MKSIASLLVLLTAVSYAADDGTPKTATKDAPFVNSLGMKFVPVEITGGPANGKRVLFSIWDTRVQDFAPYAKAKGIPLDASGLQEGPAHPVEFVSRITAKAFCEWLTNTERASGRIGSSDAYRLPSDHGWSCAVGIGKLERAEENPMSKSERIKMYPWGTQWPLPKGYCSFDPLLAVDQKEHTSEVGQFAANENGLYDPVDNVSEWCEDDPDPDGPHERPKDIFRIVRGSAYNTFDHSGFLSSRRDIADYSCQGVHLGFRRVLEVAGD
jgi:formylglycine-generating enzyme required for sulfatase activity